MCPLSLSILDQSTVASGRGADEAIRETLALAQLAEALGYRRYWLAEHHNSQSHAGTAPEMLVAAIAATTRRIRVGTAGVMLPHYSALKVAEQFRVLEAIAPGRIDLGLGRAPGSDGRTAFALNPNANEAADHFPAAGARPAGLARRRAAGEPPLPQRHRQPRRADAAGGVDPRQFRLRRAGRRLLRPALLLRLVHHRRRAAPRRRWQVYRDGLPPHPGHAGPAGGAACRARRLRAGRGDRGGGAAPVQLPRAVAALARPRHLRARCPRVEEAEAYDYSRCRARACRARCARAP